MLKSSQVNLTHRSVISRLINVAASTNSFALIGHKVFDTRTHPLGLNSIYDGSAQLTGKQRILAKGLKVSATTWISMEVDIGTQHNLHGF
jgi:hypothetical protein